MKAIAIGLACIAAGTASLPANAQPAGFEFRGDATEIELPPRYRVEFIIFAHNRFDPAEEHFDVVPPLSIFAAAGGPIPQREFGENERRQLRELIEGPIAPPPPDSLAGAALEQPGAEDPELEDYFDPALVEGPATRFLEPDELTLQSTFERLEQLSAYRPLVHGGWEQNGLAEADAVPIDLAEFLSTNPSGTLRLHMSRYLHISVDIGYDDAASPGVANAPGQVASFGDTPVQRQQGFGFGGNATVRRSATPPPYILFEQRRMLRGELNYFDHPAFGLLVKITRAPEPASGPDPETGGPSA